MTRAALRLALTIMAAAVLVGCSQNARSPHTTATPPAEGAPIAQPALSPFPDAAERKFLGAVVLDLRARFADERSARADGYVRYTDEDPAGIISFTNLRWFADDPQHPTQLWYDAHGRLIGADFTTRVTDTTRRPELWGLQSGRWVHFIAHVHYVVREPDGMMRYGSLLNPTYQANGGDIAHPGAAPLVKLGIAKQASDVALVFQLPEIWIASLWLVPNPNGAFADSNPLVKPTSAARHHMHQM